MRPKRGLHKHRALRSDLETKQTSKLLKIHRRGQNQKREKYISLYLSIIPSFSSHPTSGYSSTTAAVYTYIRWFIHAPLLLLYSTFPLSSPLPHIFSFSELLITDDSTRCVRCNSAVYCCRPIPFPTAPATNKRQNLLLLFLLSSTQ